MFLLRISFKVMRPSGARERVNLCISRYRRLEVHEGQGVVLEI